MIRKITFPTLIINLHLLNNNYIKCNKIKNNSDVINHTKLNFENKTYIKETYNIDIKQKKLYSIIKEYEYKIYTKCFNEKDFEIIKLINLIKSTSIMTIIDEIESSPYFFTICDGFDYEIKETNFNNHDDVIKEMINQEKENKYYCSHNISSLLSNNNDFNLFVITIIYYCKFLEVDTMRFIICRYFTGEKFIIANKILSLYY